MSSFIPPEVVTNILSRLPVKPLLRFRCVSKPWCSLIDSPDFAKVHLNQSTKPKSNVSDLTLGIINFSDSIELRSIDSPRVFDKFDYNQFIEPPLSSSVISSSCNGLTHVYMKKPVSRFTHHYIWNPFTRKHRELPTISHNFQGIPDDFNLKMVEKYGFAYVSETDEYKVLHVTQARGFDSSYISNQAYMFSSRSNEWERLEPFPYLITPMTAYTAHLNGAFHTVFDNEYRQWELMVFDTRTKQHSMFPKPDFSCAVVDLTVEVLEGNLCLLHKPLVNPVDDKMDIWVMKDYGVESSWFKWLSVAVEPGWGLYTHPLITEDGAECLLTNNPKTFIQYNMCGASVTELRVNALPLGFVVEVGAESLVSCPGFISVIDEKAKGQGNDRKGKKQDDVTKKIQQNNLKEKGNTSSTKGFHSQGLKLRF